MKFTTRGYVLLGVALCGALAATAEDQALRTLIVGGGSSHDFERWFHQADAATLSAGGKATVTYTEKLNEVVDPLKDADVLDLNSNQPMKDPAVRKGIFDFADAGRGLLIVHPACWYNWGDWPEYNRVLVGGGSRGHDAFGKFTVTLTDVKHPVTEGLPASFEITDELYNFEVDPKGTPIQVLATAKSLISGKTFPIIWIVQHSKARIVGITLGHDEQAHEHPAYKRLLQNAQAWVANKNGKAAALVPIPNHPLRVVLLGGAKTHGPGEHNHPLWVEQWTKLLQERKAETQSSMTWPTAAQFAWADTLAMFRAEGGELNDEQQAQLKAFMERGGGLVVLHDAVCGNKADMFKTFTGGAWQHGEARFYGGDVDEYIVDHEHPITKGVENFHIRDEIYWNLKMQPFAHVLGVSWLEPAFLRGIDKKEVFKQVPQMWTYEQGQGRAFVSLLGHYETTFDLPHVRALLLRGLAWTGKRDVDLLVTADEKKALRYPAGGPIAPDDAAKKIRVPEGFKIDLVAGEPTVVKPISMVFDARGRLWVAETVEYPWPGDQKNTHDRIVILDFDENGKVKSRKVFADGLDIPTSLLLYRDGCIVMQTPHIFFLRDTNGDDVADKREYLYTGFSRGDTHGTISNLAWGLDGWVYGAQGYDRGQIRRADENGKPTGPVVADFAAGAFRFKPDGSAFEVLTSTGSNTWGFGFDATGEAFISKANGAHVNHMVIPDRYLNRVKRLEIGAGNENIEDHTKSYCICPEPFHQIDWVNNFTAAAGATLYTGDTWPQEYRGNYFVTEPSIHIVHRDVLIPKGSTFTAHSPGKDEFVASTDPWFRPIHTVIGPDGAMYICDFYNQAIIHNDTRRGQPGSHSIGGVSVRPDRDHDHGRIWRVQWAQAPKVANPNLAKADTKTLVATLNAANYWYRETAQRLLVERNDQSAVPLLKDLLSKSASEYARIHALWTLEQLGGMEEATLVKGLTDPNPAVRKNAARVAEIHPQQSAPVLAAIAKLLADPDPLVRRDAALALSTQPSSTSQISLLQAALFDETKDKWMQLALLTAVVRDTPAMARAAFSKGAGPQGVRELLGRAALDLGARGDAAAAAQLVAAVAESPAAPADWRQICLKNLGSALPQGVKPPLDEPLKKAMVALLTRDDETVRGAAMPLAARWDEGGQLQAALKPILDKMLVQIRDPKVEEKSRLAAIGSLLGSSPNDATVAAVGSLLSPSEPLALQTEAVRALGRTGLGSVPSALLHSWGAVSPVLRGEILNVLLTRPEWTTALLDAIAAEQVKVGDLPTSTAHQLRNHPDKKISARAKTVFAKLSRPEETDKVALLAKLRPQVCNGKGDAANGKAVFEKNCIVCHKLDGKGTDVAPDLTGIGINGADWLLEQIVDPNSQIEGGFTAYNVDTKSGESYTGVIASENAQSVLLKFSGNQVSVPRDQIVKMYSTGKSLMPEGFEALGEPALRDLLAYLGGSSKFVALDLTKVVTADGKLGLFNSKAEVNDNLAFDKYGVVTVEGIPFRLLDSAATGKSLIVLQGGPEQSYSHTFPKRVEIPYGQTAKAIHFLSGSAGWGYPFSQEQTSVVVVRLHYVGGEVQEVKWLNGRHFADYIGAVDVPDSKLAMQGHHGHQLRWLTIKPARPEAIESIELVKGENDAAPVIAAVTAERP